MPLSRRNDRTPLLLPGLAIKMERIAELALQVTPTPPALTQTRPPEYTNIPPWVSTG